LKVGRLGTGKFKLKRKTDEIFSQFTQSSPKSPSKYLKKERNETLDQLLENKKPSEGLSPTNSSKTSPLSPSSLRPIRKEIVKPEMIGFPNAGLTCYLNAVLQALLGTNSFVSDLFNSSHVGDDNLIFSFNQLSLFKEEGNQTRTRFQMRQLRTELEKALPMKLNRMQDVHEFLVLFCESLASRYVKLGLKSNPFSENFHFQLEEERVCRQCHNLTEKNKEDFVLRLDLPSSPTETGERHSTQTLLKNTLLESDMRVICEICKKDKLHVAKDKFKILPRVLVLYLPRTQYSNLQKYQVRKDRIEINVNVVIDLSQHIVHTKVDKSKLSMPELDENEQMKRAMAESMLSLNEEIPVCKSPNKTQDSRLGDILSENDVSKLSEEEQINRAVAQSLKSFDETMEELGVKFLNEEDQLQMALEQSRLECIEKDEENSTLMQALEASMKIEQVGPGGDQVVIEQVRPKPQRKPQINGKTEATEEFEYQLTAVISHVNSISSVNTGHYIADVFNCQLKKWFHYDDMEVSEHSLLDVIQQSSLDGCLFFYSHKNLIKYYSKD